VRAILLGLLLSLSSVSTQAQEASNKEAESVVTADLQKDPVEVVESEEEVEARTVAEITASAPADKPAEQLLAGEMKVSKKSENENKAESQIPVLTQATKEKAKGTDPMTRLMMSLAVVVAVAIGLFFFARFWAKRKTGLTAHHQIKVLTQYALGPKKSLAIIRVAGESILIGITEQNISMIKSLALLDEEIPMDVPAQFAQELDRANQPTITADKEDFSFGSVRDIVSNRLREMRNL
jgi:flagellar protein FliO/FliZ